MKSKAKKGAVGHMEKEAKHAEIRQSVDKVQRFDVPVSAGTKSQTGYATPRTLEVTLSSAIDAV